MSLPVARGDWEGADGVEVAAGLSVKQAESVTAAALGVGVSDPVALAQTEELAVGESDAEAQGEPLPEALPVAEKLRIGVLDVHALREADPQVVEEAVKGADRVAAASVAVGATSVAVGSTEEVTEAVDVTERAGDAESDTVPLLVMLIEALGVAVRFPLREAVPDSQPLALPLTDGEGEVEDERE